jgi:hypothetical protein
MKRLVLYGFLLAFFMCAPRAHAQGACPSGAPVSGNHCYFISSASGSDSNSGTSESAPWANAPKMSTCTANCAANNPTGGTAYIFKGCDTWNFAKIGEWTPGVSGSAGNPIYFGGFDQSWYNSSACPNGWNRPIFSGEGTWPGTNGSYFLDFDEDNYWRVAWIEFTGLFTDCSTGCNSSLGYMSAGVGVASFEFDHNYLHGFTFYFPNSCTVSGNSYPCTEPFGLNMSSTPAASGEIDHNVFSGQDTTGKCNGCWSTSQDLGLWLTGSFHNVEIDHNWMGYGDCIVGTFYMFHDNTMYSCGPFSAAANSVHNNVFENNADPPQGTLMYNNLSSNAGALGYATVSQLAPNSGVTSYFFNNVTENYLGGQTGGQLAFSCSTPSGGGGGLCVLFNNTMECGPDSGPNSPPSLACAVAGAAPLTMDSFYNHYITSSSSAIQCYQNACGTVLQLPNPNLAQPLSAANNQGYSLGSYFAPQNGSGATIQAGFTPTALLAQCAAVGAVNAGAGTACQSSTTAGVTLVTSPYYSIGGSTVTPVARLISGSTKNDAGAFQFGGASTTTGPQPPSGLTATVN